MRDGKRQSKKARRRSTSLYSIVLIPLFRFPGGSDGKASDRNAGDSGSTPGSGSSLKKEMAMHSSILAWRIPWTEDPGRLQATGSQRVGLDFTLTFKAQTRWRYW